MFMRMIVMVLVLLLAGATQVMAEGYCNSEDFGKDVKWKMFTGDKNVKMRSCCDSDEVTHIDVKNDNPFEVCFEVEDKDGRGFSRWPVPPNTIITPKRRGCDRLSYGAFHELNYPCKDIRY
jgi:hypothetical protein